MIDDHDADAVPRPPKWRVRYFWISQAGTLLCVLGCLVVLAGLPLRLHGVGPAGLLLYPLIILPLNGALAAAIGAYRPAVPDALTATVLYALLGASVLVPRWFDKWEEHHRDRVAALGEAAVDGRWVEFEDRLYPWLHLMGEDGLVHVERACLRRQEPPLGLFVRVAEDADLHPTLRTVVAALCGVEHTRWTLANGGSVVPKHFVAPSPLAFARDDEVFALLLEAGATVDQRDPEHSEDPPPLFYADDAANVRRLHAAGADIFFINQYGQNALGALYGYAWVDDAKWALHGPRDYVARMEQLIELGLDVNHRDHKGSTPLHTHVVKDDAVRLLLRHGADPYAKDADGVSALHGIDERLRTQLRSEGLLGDPTPQDEDPLDLEDE